MSEPKLVTDREGDEWARREDGLYWCPVETECPARPFYELEEDWGPLTVVEEWVPGMGLQPKGQTFAGLNALAEALTKPIPDVPLAAMFTASVPEEVVNKAATSSGDDFPSNAFSVYNEAFNILLKKNADYGPSNIADSPGGPLNGILVRMWDKMSRLRHLVESGATPENESLRDTLMDMANYSLIAMIVLDGNWPGMEDK